MLILFLPAAGFQYGKSYNGGYVAQWGVEMLSASVAQNFLASASSFRTMNNNGNFDKFRIRSVRLATVVSGLTVEMSSVPACCRASFQWHPCWG